MPLRIVNKNSTVQDKVPLASDLQVGEIAINANVNSPAAYIKDSAGNVVKLAGAGSVGDDWTRTGTALSPKTAGDTVQFSAGTAALPGVTPVGDTDTGIYSPGANQVAISTNGTGRLFVDASGNIGVGAPSSITGLELSNSIQIKYAGINSDPGGSRYLIFNNTDTTLVNDQPLGGISWVNNDDGATAGEAAFVKAYTASNTGAAYLTLGTGGQNAASEKLRITSDGKLGLGTSSPDASLAVLGGPSVDGTMFPTGNLIASFASSVGDSELITLGNQSLTASTFTMAFVPRRAGSVGGQHGWYQKIDSTSSAAGSYTLGTLQRASSGGAPETPRFHIDSSGRVGVGTTSPGGILNLDRPDLSVDTWLRVSQSGTEVFSLSQPSTSEIRFSTPDLGVDRDFTFYTKGTERARIDSSGRLLVGTSSGVSTGSSVQAALQVVDNSNLHAAFRMNRNDSAGPVIAFGKSRSTSDGGFVVVQSNDELGTIRFAGADGGDLQTQGASIAAYVDGTPGANDMPGRLVFSTTADGASSPTERMRISSNGFLNISGTSSNPAAENQTNMSAIGSGAFRTSATNVGLQVNRKGTDGAAAEFRRDGAVVGTISVTTSATAYNTSSDYRLKENVTAVTDGITRLQRLKPSRFNFIADPDKTVDGFLAHEVQTIVPEAITGEKDAVDADGNPEYQGIDQSKLVPLLTAALQEAIGEIESLKARLTAAGI